VIEKGCTIRGGLSIADFNCDGIVDGHDLGTLPGAWTVH